MAQFHPLEQHILRVLDRNHLRQKQFVLLVSGGLDSMTLLNAFEKIQKTLAQKPIVLHVHHQDSQNQNQDDFRFKALEKTKSQAEKAGFKFITNHQILAHKPKSQSENDLRQFRQAVIKQLIDADPNTVFVTAHHLDDQVETQFHRLVRGTGPKGIQGMSIYNGHILRPFLEMPKKDLESYAREFKIEMVQDPSNLEVSPFRNWLRLQWLPELEKRSPGSLKSLQRSFRQWSESLKVSELIQNQSVQLTQNEGGSVEAETFHSWDPSLQRVKIYHWLSSNQRRSQKSQITSQIVEEILKQLKACALDTGKKEHTFKSGGVTWFVTPRYILFFADKGPDLTSGHEGIIFTS